jgi:hypothetical protein
MNAVPQRLVNGIRTSVLDEVKRYKAASRLATAKSSVSSDRALDISTVERNEKFDLSAYKLILILEIPPNCRSSESVLLPMTIHLNRFVTDATTAFKCYALSSHPLSARSLSR